MAEIKTNTTMDQQSMSTVSETKIDRQAISTETETKVSYIDIAIIGSVSTGKTTLLNTIFGCNFGNMRIMRETMFPQVYIECDDVKEFNLEEIKKKNSQDNKVEFVEHKIPKIIPKQFYYKITDYPGIDDATKSAEFFSCLEKNINNHDIIIWLISLTSPLNTEGELKIKAVLDKHADRTIVCINKSDHLIEGECFDDEIKEIIQHIKEKCSSYKNVFEITTLYAYVINSIVLGKLRKKYPTFSRKEVNIVGSKLIGIKWGKLTEKQRFRELKELCTSELLEKIGYTNLLNEIDLDDVDEITTSRFDRLFLINNKNQHASFRHKCYGICKQENHYKSLYHNIAKYIHTNGITKQIAVTIADEIYRSDNLFISKPSLYIIEKILPYLDKSLKFEIDINITVFSNDANALIEKYENTSNSSKISIFLNRMYGKTYNDRNYIELYNLYINNHICLYYKNLYSCSKFIELSIFPEIIAYAIYIKRKSNNNTFNDDELRIIHCVKNKIMENLLLDPLSKTYKGYYINTYNNISSIITFSSNDKQYGEDFIGRLVLYMTYLFNTEEVDNVRRYIKHNTYTTLTKNRIYYFDTIDQINYYKTYKSYEEYSSDNGVNYINHSKWN